MIDYPSIDPVAIEIGKLKIHWYGLMYIAGFVAAFLLARRRSRSAGSIIAKAQVDDLIFYGALGVIGGGRIGYLLFYGWAQMAVDPLYPLKVWQGGMSFHGGLIGVLIAMWFYARKLDQPYFAVMDFVAPLVPIGLGTGRLGNFINGELWGKPTDVPWGMMVNGRVLHPSQLYEALLEGLVLFVILWWYSGKRPPQRAVSGMFLLLYGSFRFAIEFVRVPDSHINYLAFDWLTMGQLLSTPMLVFGTLLLWLAYKKPSEKALA